MSITPQDIQDYSFWAVAGSTVIGIVWYLLKNNVKDTHNLLLEIRNEIKKIPLATGRTVPTHSQIASITKNAIWKQSEPKLEYLKKLLIENSIQERKERLKVNIRTELLRQSAVYISYLNEYYCTEWLVWDYVGSNFPMESFLTDLYEVFFEDIPYNTELEKEVNLKRKIDDIRLVMLQYQNQFIDDFYNKIKD